MEPVRKDMELLSNSMATYAHIKANPESFALYFMMGVCFGLLMALCLLIASIACRSGRPSTAARKPPPSSERRKLKESIEVEEDEEDEEDSDVEEEEEGASADVSKVELGTMRSVNVFSSAEELEKARRLEERERIVREIWRNGQPDVLVNGTGTIGRVHYH